MNTTTYLSLMTLSLGLFLSQRAACAQDANHIVVPGKSLGQISLGITPSQVHKLLGKPDKTLRLKNKVVDDLYKSKRERNTIFGVIRDKVEVLYARGKVVQIEATSPTFRTSEGFCTVVGLEPVRHGPFTWQVLNYGYQSAQGVWNNFYFWDQERGLTLEYAKQDGPLPGGSWPTTVIVHRQGVRVLPDAGGKLLGEPTDVEAFILH